MGRGLSDSESLWKMYSRKQIEHLRLNDEINDSDEGFMLGYLSAFDDEN